MADVVEIHKLKLVELKQECSARGLEIKGNKQDLINRLQAYLEEHAEEEANEEDVLGEETEEEEQKPIEPPAEEEIALPTKSPETEADKKVVKIATGLPQTERLQKRAERFNVPSSLESKKAARAARFGTVTVTAKDNSSDIKPAVNMSKLKERAQRFGLNVSSVSKKSLVEAPCKLLKDDTLLDLMIKTVFLVAIFSAWCMLGLQALSVIGAHGKKSVEFLQILDHNYRLSTSSIESSRDYQKDYRRKIPRVTTEAKGHGYTTKSQASDDDEKLKKRKERFGIVTSSAGVTEDSEAKKRKRAERFGIV